MTCEDRGVARSLVLVETNTGRSLTESTLALSRININELIVNSRILTLAVHCVRKNESSLALSRININELFVYSRTSAILDDMDRNYCVTTQQCLQKTQCHAHTYTLTQDQWRIQEMFVGGAEKKRRMSTQSDGNWGSGVSPLNKII